MQRVDGCFWGSDSKRSESEQRETEEFLEETERERKEVRKCPQNVSTIISQSVVQSVCTLITSLSAGDGKKRSPEN